MPYNRENQFEFTYVFSTEPEALIELQNVKDINLEWQGEILTTAQVIEEWNTDAVVSYHISEVNDMGEAIDEPVGYQSYDTRSEARAEIWNWF